MKLVTPEISWHGRDPIYSIDFQYLKGNMRRMATCGTDKNIMMWNIVEDKEGKPTPEFLATLTRHNRAVNVVRFSPDGELLASGGDDSYIMLWKLNDTLVPVNNIFQEEEAENKEIWSTFKVLRGHLEDVYDLSWSKDSRYILSGSVDNSAILWDAKKGQSLKMFTEHKSFVQGVAFDPLQKYLATLSSDRSLRVFSTTSKACLANTSKISVPNAQNADGETKPKSFKMYHDDTMKSFFRRLTWTPDGQLLITPAGCIESGDKTVNATYVFVRGQFSKPGLYLPVPQKATIAVKCCPILFELNKKLRPDVDPDDEKLKEWEKYSTIFSLPYRMVFAVATEDSVLLYDTQQSIPVGYISNIHYHQLSDLTWSQDGRLLAVSSTDGYVSMVHFNENELGIPYKEQPVTISDPVKKLANEETQASSPSTLSTNKQKSDEPGLIQVRKKESPENKPKDSGEASVIQFRKKEKQSPKSKPVDATEATVIQVRRKENPKLENKDPDGIKIRKKENSESDKGSNTSGATGGSDKGEEDQKVDGKDDKATVIDSEKPIGPQTPTSTSKQPRRVVLTTISNSPSTNQNQASSSNQSPVVVTNQIKNTDAVMLKPGTPKQGRRIQLMTMSSQSPSRLPSDSSDIESSDQDFHLHLESSSDEAELSKHRTLHGGLGDTTSVSSGTLPTNSKSKSPRRVNLVTLSSTPEKRDENETDSELKSQTSKMTLTPSSKIDKVDVTPSRKIDGATSLTPTSRPADGAKDSPKPSRRVQLITLSASPSSTPPNSQN
ncbi:unnamed protein product [Owenia fusiformis]|uniref:CAF1B/HIR1 beta-propeller domain-containing protein n=1 Tax=Owenia fusiformis TaxID=6347 RepID=A0A8J1TCJ2_OWEFU|nr:unnamed protein product [Owenia fusiformis]